MAPIANQLDLRSLLGVLRKRLRWIVGTALLVHFLALGLMAKATTTYTSEAELLLDSSTDATVRAGADARSTEIQILLGDGVRAMATKRLGFDASVEAMPQGAANAIVVRATSPVAARAAKIANAYALAYIDFRREQAVDDIEKAIERLQTRSASLATKLTSVDSSLKNEPDGTDQRRSLESQRTVLVEQRTMLQTQIESFEVDAATQTGGATVNRTAGVPTSASGSPPLRTLALAFPMGLLAGIGVALFRDAIEDRVTGADDVERVMGTVPVLAAIPDARRKIPTFVAAETPLAPIAEAFRSLRTSVQFLGVDRPLRVVLVTSAMPGEGKSCVAANLAASIALAGTKVVLVDADLRASRMSDEHDLGLSSVLLGAVPLEEATHRVASVPGLEFIPAGYPPPNPAELLGTNRMRDAFDALRARYEVVVVDSPPVLAVTDPVVLSEHADAVVLVARVGKTTRRQLSRAAAVLTRVKAPVQGTVLNASDESMTAYYPSRRRRPARRLGRSTQKKTMEPLEREFDLL